MNYGSCFLRAWLNEVEQLITKFYNYGKAKKPIEPNRSIREIPRSEKSLKDMTPEELRYPYIRDSKQYVKIREI